MTEKEFKNYKELVEYFHKLEVTALKCKKVTWVPDGCLIDEILMNLSMTSGYILGVIHESANDALKITFRECSENDPVIDNWGFSDEFDNGDTEIYTTEFGSDANTVTIEVMIIDLNSYLFRINNPGREAEYISIVLPD